MERKIDVTHCMQTPLTESKRKQIDRCCSLYYLMMGSIYNTVQSAMVDARDAIQDTPLYRQQIKQNIRKALKKYDELNNKIKQSLDDKYQLWLDTTDRADEILQPHIFKLSISINSFLLKNNYPNREVISKMETARILADIANKTFTRMFQFFRQSLGFNLATAFTGGDFADILFWWSKATRQLFNTTHNINVNLNDDPNISLAVEIIMQKMQDHNILNEAGNYALHRNPDQWKFLDKEDRLRLKAGQDIAGPEEVTSSLPDISKLKEKFKHDK